MESPDDRRMKIFRIYMLTELLSECVGDRKIVEILRSYSEGKLTLDDAYSKLDEMGVFVTHRISLQDINPTEDDLMIRINEVLKNLSEK